MPPAPKHTNSPPKKRALAAPHADGPRIRNKGIVKVLVADLVANGANYRIHSDAQHKALTGTVEAIGWYGAPDVRQLADGRYELIDGHMRRQWLLDQYGEGAEIEVNVTDLTEEEARIALATKDPLTAMATQDAGQLEDLLNSIKSQSGQVDAFLAELAAVNSVELIDQMAKDTLPEPEDTLPEPEDDSDGPENTNESSGVDDGPDDDEYIVFQVTVRASEARQLRALLNDVKKKQQLETTGEAFMLIAESYSE